MAQPMRGHRFLYLLLFPLLFLSGCQTADSQVTISSNPQASETALVEAAQSIDNSLAVLASAQEAKSPPVVSIGPLVTPEGGMGGAADIDWAGPIGPLMTRLADMTNYRVKFLGTPPAIPIVVSITARDTAVAEILQNASLQAGQRAKVLVFPENRVIEVRYLN